ncbi:LysR family transcriptional regulator [Erysipelatoclostridium ramosum]|nr:LysR family transcriptional regulator [Thomasclavelia ramosa]
MAKNQTMTKAAQQLHISQPALSIGLKNLEED